MQAYRDGIQFGNPEFTQYVKAYKSHHRTYFNGWGIFEYLPKLPVSEFRVSGLPVLQVACYPGIVFHVSYIQVS